MGYTFYELIPAAILFYHPNITKEEFAQKIDEVKFSKFKTFEENDPWDSHDSSLNFRSKRLRNVAEILGLEETKEFKEFSAGRKDKLGIPIKAPQLSVNNCTVYVHQKNKIYSEKEIESYEWKKLEVRNVWIEFHGTEKGLVKEIIKEEKLENNGSNEKPKYRYKLVLIPFEEVWKIREFSSEKKLLKSWPQFDPEFVYNFSQPEGNFRVSSSRDDWKWAQKDGKYFLSPETFNKIPDGYSTSASISECLEDKPPREGYRDLVLTAEAIRQKAWKMFSYRGLIHTKQFFRDFSDSLEIYSRAVYDSYTSIYAKKKGMTTTEFLRWRAEMRTNNISSFD